MATVAPPVALTIALDFEPKPVPESLVTRLTTPPSSPTRDKNKQMQAAEKLREAHISAVKARAERDLQRARDAQERKVNASCQLHIAHHPPAFMLPFCACVYAASAGRSQCTKG